MDFNKREDLISKTDEEVEKKKPKKTKEEIANWWKDYYEWVKTIYPLESFEIYKSNGEKLYFHRSNPSLNLDKGSKELVYYLRDEKFKELEEQRITKNLKGEEPNNSEEEDKILRIFKALIIIDKKKKKFSFSVNFEYEGNSYGKAIYDNYLQILDFLGIEDKEQYELRVGNNPDHIFLKHMYTKDLIARTNSEPSTINAKSILEDFAKYPHTVKLSDVNAIVDYAIKSNISIEEISQSLNNNGFNIHRNTLSDEEIQRFREFGITGLKATYMHKHFMRFKNFEFMKLITEADKEDTTLEFRRIFEEIKTKREQEEKEQKYIPENMKEYGEVEHIILDWKHAGLLLRNLNKNIQQIIKKQMINKFEEFDPEHKSYLLTEDANSMRTFAILKASGLMDKETYITLYQKTLNRNYDLEEFDSAISRFIDIESRTKAKQEISQSSYYPYPKKNWQKSRLGTQEHRIAKIEIPQKVSKKGNIKEAIKQEIINQGIAKKTKIITDMTGINKDGKPIIVDNLKDWLFGVPGARGNIHMMGTAAVTLPPQTPEFAIKLIEQVLKDMTYPGVGGRDEI